MRRTALIVLLSAGAVAGCGGGGSPPQPPRAQTPTVASGVVGGLARSIDAAKAAVSHSQLDAQRASATSAGPGG